MVSKKIIHKLQLETIKNNKNGAQTNLLIAPPQKKQNRKYEWWDLPKMQ